MEIKAKLYNNNKQKKIKLMQMIFQIASTRREALLTAKLNVQPGLKSIFTMNEMAVFYRNTG